MRRQWGLGLVALVVGIPLGLLTGGLGILPVLVLLPVAAGRTLALAQVVPASWLVLAVAVPALPVLTAVGAILGIFNLWAEPVILFVLAMAAGVVAAVVLAALLVAWGIEVGRVRRSSVRRPHARVEE
ncbi:hypothetical protein CFI00_08105 [Nocardioides sp. S5]|uniref:hypothetical protein n=1 Tax=Nocardioides sp. S5 TaxID=2017486 RepID=UPI001A8DE78D|nr:hypothetical protein [Nocardioides sp. S5]QSR30467.1 hypothetical protein CFI00_08105 [Nocardioides sp. S5]